MDDPMQPMPPDLQAELAAAEAVPAPGRLRAAVDAAVRDAQRSTDRRRRLRAPRVLAPAAAALAAVTAALVLALGGGAGAPAPSARDAARIALRPATLPAPAARPGGQLLAARVAGIAYPSWTHVGWRAVGARADALGGRRVHTVYYADARGRRIGYAIAAGEALPARGGRVVERRGVAIRVLAVDGATVVTWRREGHTCVLAARGVAPARLVQLASYST